MPYAMKLERLLNKQDLSTREAKQLMDSIMDGKLTAIQIAGMLIAFRAKGATVQELTGMAKSMIAHAEKVVAPQKNIVDTCGTGGDLAGTFNISTLAAIVASAAGAIVAKHGNRSVSSHCGSADLLEALGVKIDLTPEQTAQCLTDINFAFFFAPTFHKAMKYAVPARQELGVRTIFNLLGPIVNPARATRQLIGVYEESLTSSVAQTLRNLDVKRAMVVHAGDGLDEITISGPTKISEIKPDGYITTYRIDPGMYGLTIGSKADLLSDSAAMNIKITKLLLEGKDIGARRDAVLMNAGSALYLSEITDSIKEGIALARRAIESGRAQLKLEEIIAYTNNF